MHFLPGNSAGIADVATAGISIVTALKARMQWHQARQKLIAQNVANADTPGFRPKELVQPKAGAASVPAQVAVERTNNLHLASAMSGSGKPETGALRFETRPSGNAVSLEDEMMRVAENQADYQLAASLYQKSLSMLRIAAGGRG
jgi:flagellar basal-body rod protein FlgB